MILIIGDPRDPHVRRVAEEVAARGEEPAIFCKYNSDCRVSLRDDKGHRRLDFRIGDRRFAGDSVTAVWWRQKPFTFFDRPEADLAPVEQFAEREWFQPLQSLHHALGPTGVRWMNDPWRQLQANLKPVQIDWARRSGLAVPDTLFSNDRAAILDFAGGAASLVYKTFSGFVVEENRFVFATVIDRAALAATGPQDLGLAPGIYQHYVDKAYELRVTFVDDRLFPIKIDSQRHPETRFDWRRDQTIDIYEATTLPREDEQALRAFVALSGLRYGAIDAIVTPQGQLQFLECNPAGQWLWLEHFTGVPLCAAVAEALCDRRGGGAASDGALTQP